MGFLKRSSNKLPHNVLLRIYKVFVRSHLDYGDILYDKPNNESFISRLERMQFKACLAITGTIQSASHECLYEKLGLESLIDRRWVCKLTFFYKIVKRNSPEYLSNYLKRNNNQISLNAFGTRTEKFKNSFFPFCISE